MAIAMKRILGNEKKQRVQTTVMVENDFLKIIKENNIAFSDFVNIQIESGLSAKGLIKN